MKKMIINKKTELINGKSIVITRIRTKDKKVTKYVDRSNNTCPNCQSLLKLNDLSQFECTGNKLKIWEKELIAFSIAEGAAKQEILNKFSNTSLFLELYDRWEYCLTNENDTFDCGYTNEIFPLISQSVEKIPDPLVVKRVEQKLGRKLTFDELLGEVELFSFGGRILTEWRPKARQVRIPWIVLPSLNEVSV